MQGRLLITGATGFTGRHLACAAGTAGLDVVPLRANLSNKAALVEEVSRLQPDYIVHLAAISSVTHGDPEEVYRINLFGTLNLLEATSSSASPVRKILLASSANVYGGHGASPISEASCPEPVNHYGLSKYAMERMALAYDRLPIVIARPFNYTGVGHDERFVIPKLINHFTSRSPIIELGNTTVEREYNDVRAVCTAYLRLLERGVAAEIYNICSGEAFSLDEVVHKLRIMTGHDIEVVVNKAFLRKNEILKLCGSAEKLEHCIGKLEHPGIDDTLSWMIAEHMP